MTQGATLEYLSRMQSLTRLHIQLAQKATINLAAGERSRLSRSTSTIIIIHLITTRMSIMLHPITFKRQLTI